MRASNVMHGYTADLCVLLTFAMQGAGAICSARLLAIYDIFSFLHWGVLSWWSWYVYGTWFSCNRSGAVSEEYAAITRIRPSRRRTHLCYSILKLIEGNLMRNMRKIPKWFIVFVMTWIIRVMMVVAIISMMVVMMMFHIYNLIMMMMWYNIMCQSYRKGK